MVEGFGFRVQKVLGPGLRVIVEMFGAPFGPRWVIITDSSQTLLFARCSRKGFKVRGPPTL